MLHQVHEEESYLRIAIDRVHALRFCMHDEFHPESYTETLKSQHTIRWQCRPPEVSHVRRFLFQGPLHEQ